MKKKSIAMLVAVVLLFGALIGGTVAWLQSESDEVVNTFTFGDINIKLDETNTDKKDANGNDSNVERDTVNAYDLIPGDTAVKDPKVTVENGSEKCYVFVTVSEENNTLNGAKIIDFDIDTIYWKLVDGTDNMYVYEKSGDKIVNATSAEYVTESVLATIKDANEQDTGKHIKVNTALTKEAIEGMAADTAKDKAATYPEISFDACAVQSQNIKYDAAVALAKELLKDSLNTTN